MRAWTDRNVGVTRDPFGVRGGEDGEDEDEGSDDLGGESDLDGVAGAEGVGAAAVVMVERALQRLDQSNSGDGPKTLRRHVHRRPYHRHFPRQQHPKRHRRINMPSCKLTYQIPRLVILDCCVRLNSVRI